MKKITIAATAALVGVGAGAAGEHIRHAASNTTPQANEAQVELKQDRYRAMLERSGLKIVGGFPGEDRHAAKVNPEEVAKRTVNSIGSYALQLRREKAQGKLPEGVNVTPDHNRNGELASIQVQVAGEGSNGVREIVLNALFNSENRLGGRLGLTEGGAFVTSEMLDGSTREENAIATAYRIPRVEEGKPYWSVSTSKFSDTFGFDINIDSDNSNRNNSDENSRVAIGTEEFAESALANARQMIADLREQQ